MTDTQASENPAGVVYGIITMGALLAAEGGRQETYLEVIGSAAIALVLYWFAHSYSSLLGDRLASREHLTVTSLGHTFLHDWAIVRGASIPFLALLVTWALGGALQTAVTIAVWTSAVSLVVFELLAGVRAKATPAELAIEACVGAAMGLGVLLLRILLH
jgi:hypothetical protein